jgi:hypothetical protein
MRDRDPLGTSDRSTTGRASSSDHAARSRGTAFTPRVLLGRLLQCAYRARRPGISTRGPRRASHRSPPTVGSRALRKPLKAGRPRPGNGRIAPFALPGLVATLPPQVAGRASRTRRQPSTAASALTRGKPVISRSFPGSGLISAMVRPEWDRVQLWADERGIARVPSGPSGLCPTSVAD